MKDLETVLKDTTWRLVIESLANSGGDGPRLDMTGTPDSFRSFAKLLTTMADQVDMPGHVAHQHGWHLGLNPDDLVQLETKPRTILRLICLPADRLTD